MDQTTRVYSAEEIVYRQAYPKFLSTLGACQSYLESIQQKRWFRNAYPEVSSLPIKIKPTKTNYVWAKAEQNSIHLNAWSQADYYIIHELSHFCSHESEEEHHGPQFCRALLDIVDHQISHELAVKLRHSFLAWGVDFR